MKRLLARLASRFLAYREPAPSPVYRCCLAAKNGGSEASYALHRVRFHGEGSA